jgi:hypothetical protein
MLLKGAINMIAILVVIFYLLLNLLIYRKIMLSDIVFFIALGLYLEFTNSHKMDLIFILSSVAFFVVVSVFTTLLFLYIKDYKIMELK